MRHQFGIDTNTVEWHQGQVRQNIDEFPQVELLERDGVTVRAYENRPESLDALFCDAVNRAPSREALVFPETGKRITYDELEMRVDRVAGGMHDAGIERGDAVAIMLPNRPEFVETVLACARLGIVSVPVNIRFAPGDVEHVFDDTEPAAIVTAPGFVETILETDYEFATGEIFVTGGSEYKQFAYLYDHNSPAVDPPDEDDLATILYTSGSTSFPKACPMTNFKIVNAALNYVNSYQGGDGLRSLCIAPLFHNSGLMGSLLSTFAYAGTVVIREDFDTRTFLETIEAEEIEYVAAAPTVFVLTIEREDPSAYDLSSWKILFYGGAPMSIESIQRVREEMPGGLALSQAYGTTEISGGLASVAPDQNVDEHPDSVGIPTPVTELKVVDEDGESMPPGEIGELAIKGPFVVGKYLNLPEKTASTFQDGWQHTGDIGLITEKGFVKLKGRNDDMIIRGAENIYPIEVEEALLQHSGVIEACAVGFPDEVLGQRVLAAVIPKPETRLTEEELQETCEPELAEYKIPDVFRIMDEFPRNPSGVVVKEELLPEPLRFGIAAGGSKD
jgi:acyl-CoA synthetase (AMP-forming)/AMP-acid ligase II